MSIKRRRHMTFLLSLIITGVSVCAAQSLSDQIKQFDDLVITEAKKDNSGMAIAVIADGKIVYSKAMGLANTETKQPMTVETLFPLSPLSYAYSALAMASLAQEGIIKLDEPVSTYWPELNPQVGRATIRQLMQYRGGMADKHVDYALLDAEALKRFALSCDTKCVIADPGYVTSSSSRSPNMAAAVAEHVAGVNFADLLDARVFKPMRFKYATLSVIRAATYPLAQGHRINNSEMEIVRPLALNWIGWPSTSVFSCLSQDISVIGALVNEGEWDGRQVFPKSVIAETLSLLEKREGVFTGNYGWAGYALHYFIQPEKRFGVVILRNAPATSLAALSASARKIWLGTNPATSIQIPELKPTPIDEKEANELVGIYENEYIIRLDIRDGKLMFFGDGAGYKPPSEWIAVSSLGNGQYLLAKRHLPYGTDLTIVRSAKGEITHILHARRAFRRKR